MRKSIVKKLSANDVGETGAHQAGILVPKQQSILTFFPVLDQREKNPRVTLTVRDKLDGSRWEFNYIYYNNKLFGGTRNEYRLTCMTEYLRSAGAKTNDELELSQDENGSIHVGILRNQTAQATSAPGVLVLSGGWKVINV